MTAKKTPSKAKKPAARKPRAAATDSKKPKASRAKSPKKEAKPRAKKSPAPTPKKEAKPRAKKPVPKYIDDAIARAIARSKGEARIYEFAQVEDLIEPDKRKSAEADFISWIEKRDAEERDAKKKAEDEKREKLASSLLESIETERETGKPRREKGAGRALEFTEALKVDFLVEIMLGRAVKNICEDSRFPSRMTVYRHLAADSEFSDRYARAHEVAADDEFDDMVKIIDDCPADKGAIMKAREQIRVRQYRLAKQMPEKYGPKSTLTVVGSNRIAPIEDHDGVEEAREKYENARDFDF